tara:strand:+ start:89 stop:1039 length:951 start_codon:yes stop_codon:yes gene_type:complete
MTPIKHLLNNVLDIKSDKHNLNQGNEFVKNKMKYLFKPKLIEGMGCTINDRNDPKYARFLIPSNDSHVLDGASCTIDENKPAGVTCDSSTGLFAFSGCEPVTIGDKIKVEQQKQLVLNEKINNNSKIDVTNNGRNVVVDGVTYFVNQNNNYYKYVNSIGDSTFKPRHVNFSTTCPKTAPTIEKRITGFIEGIIDPVNDDQCPLYELDSEEQLLYAQIMESTRKLRDLQAQQMEQQTDTSGLQFKKNKETIKLSKQFMDYNEMVKKSKYYTDKVNALNLSHSEILKGITMLQLQYGFFGISSIALIFLIVKIMANKE